jgi:hypothetical protein
MCTQWTRRWAPHPNRVPAPPKCRKRRPARLRLHRNVGKGALRSSGSTKMMKRAPWAAPTQPNYGKDSLIVRILFHQKIMERALCACSGSYKMTEMAPAEAAHPKWWKRAPCSAPPNWNYERAPCAAIAPIKWRKGLLGSGSTKMIDMAP